MSRGFQAVGALMRGRGVKVVVGCIGVLALVLWMESSSARAPRAQAAPVVPVSTAAPASTSAPATGGTPSNPLVDGRAVAAVERSAPELLDAPEPATVAAEDVLSPQSWLREVGSRTVLVQSTDRRFARRDGRWRAVDPTLERRPDGTPRPC